MRKIILSAIKNIITRIIKIHLYDIFKAKRRVLYTTIIHCELLNTELKQHINFGIIDSQNISQE